MAILYLVQCISMDTLWEEVLSIPIPKLWYVFWPRDENTVIDEQFFEKRVERCLGIP